jgi:acyl carrier protein
MQRIAWKPEEIRDILRTFIVDEFLPGEDPRNLTDDLPLVSGGILDSIATLKLILFMEERFGIRLEAHEADKENLNTLALIAELVQSKAR